MSKNPCFLSNKNIIFDKNKTGSKMEIGHTLLETKGLHFSLHKISELKVKLWCVQAAERKKCAFFVTFILSEGNIFKIWVLSQCIMYLINFLKIYSSTRFLLVFKIVESLQRILKNFFDTMFFVFEFDVIFLDFLYNICVIIVYRAKQNMKIGLEKTCYQMIFEFLKKTFYL